MASVPGTVINYTPAATGAYNGCPSLAILPDGDYLASHSHFGPGTSNSETFVYRSRDRGASWQRIAHLHGQIWSKLFVHDAAVYLLGTDHCDRSGGRLNGRIVIRRSRDGVEWTEPRDSASGLLADEDGYHTAPVSVVVHGGRIWKAMEFAPEPERKTWKTFVMSAPADADLLDRSQWTFSEMYQHLWSDSQWIEGNVVVTPRGDLVNVLRLNRDKSFILNDGPHYGGDERAAVVHVSADGTRLSHEPRRRQRAFHRRGHQVHHRPGSGFVDLPGHREPTAAPRPVAQQAGAVSFQRSPPLARGKGAPVPPRR